MNDRLGKKGKTACVWGCLLYCAEMGWSCEPLTCNWIRERVENCAGGEPTVKNSVKRIVCSFRK